MLNWCAYCQQFTGESPQYDDFRITHGLCARCETRKLDLFSASTVGHADFLRGIFDRLFGAGCRNDFETAARIVDEAIAAHCRPVDVLVGMIAPMLFQIGEDWKRGVITVEGEHRFTDRTKACSALPAYCHIGMGFVESRADLDIPHSKLCGHIE